MNATKLGKKNLQDILSGEYDYERQPLRIGEHEDFPFLLNEKEVVEEGQTYTYKAKISYPNIHVYGSYGHIETVQGLAIFSKYRQRKFFPDKYLWRIGSEDNIYLDSHGFLINPTWFFNCYYNGYGGWRFKQDYSYRGVLRQKIHELEVVLPPNLFSEMFDPIDQAISTYYQRSRELDKKVNRENPIIENIRTIARGFRYLDQIDAERAMKKRISVLTEAAKGRDPSLPDVNEVFKAYQETLRRDGDGTD